MIRKKLALAVMVGTTGTAMLSSVVTAEEAQKIEEVIVWSTQVRASSVYLQNETIEMKQADHISDLLRSIPGIDVGGAHSLNQRITIRSMDDKDLRITIDGANQNTYMYHHMGNLQIHADILNSVDIDIGTNSVINGGLGGSVRFETKTAQQLLKPEQQFGGRVQYSYNDNSGSSYALTGYGQLTDTVDILAYYNDVKRDNYEVGEGEILDASGNEVPGTDGEVRGLKGDLDDALIKFGWDVSQHQRLELGYETYGDKGNYSYRPDMGLATDLAITNNLQIPLLWPTEFSRDTLTLNYDLTWGESSTLKTAVFRNESILERNELGWAENPAFAGSAAVVKGEAENSGINLLGETRIDGQTLTYGGEVIRYKTSYSANYLSGSSEGSGEEATNSAVFIQDKIQLGSFAIIPGLRYDNFEIDSSVVDDTFSEFTWALAAEWEVSDQLLTKISTTQLFKGPEIGEVFVGAGLSDTANPEIEAETGFNTEFSIAYQDAVLGAEQFSTGITLFRTEISDYIYDYASAPAGSGSRYWKDNIGDMNIEGYEAYLGYERGEIKILLTYSEAESDLDAFDEYMDRDGARLDRQQGDTLSLSFDYHLPSPSLTLHWDVLHVEGLKNSASLDGATLDTKKDGFTVHNISAQWAAKSVEGLTLTVGVDNLFDEFYASQSSRTGLSLHPRFGELYLVDYEPGRNVKATIAYQF